MYDTSNEFIVSVRNVEAEVYTVTGHTHLCFGTVEHTH